MPALYLSHGAPPVFNDAHWMDQLFGWSLSMPKPTAILIVSAHWESAPLMISAPDAGTPLVYDFGGFAPPLLRDDLRDAGRLARWPDRSPRCCPTEPVHEHPSRGLDHGAWVPLKVMYPYADVPVLQLSMPTHDPDRAARDRRQAAASCASQGVLIIGSGYMTHGLPFLERRQLGAEPASRAGRRDFDAWAAEALASGAVDRLADFRHAPGMPYAHPTVEHYTPMFVTFGAATDPDRARRRSSSTTSRWVWPSGPSRSPNLLL